ncbi:MAG: DUF5009 domain-containing protein [Planctomycetales bacterium]|nr:DUF5009 domain-containing protein [Planctomycetales bacterium]
MNDTSPAVAVDTTHTGPQRLMSLDALRGFDMFWIIGADSLVAGLRRLTDSPLVATLADQLEHAEWEGFRFYDLIFPLFVFLMGASTVFSLSKFKQDGSASAAYPRVFRRFVLLYLLGLIYYGGQSRGDDPEMFRYLGVLQRIALCYLGSALLFLHLKTRGLIVACGVLLIGYWALLTFVPVPGHGAGVYEEGQNLTNYLDAHYLPGFKWDGAWDPEGMLSTLPAVASGLLGVLAGLVIRREDLAGQRKTLYLAAVGAACLVAGYAWGVPFPVIKKLWTSSFVLVAGGWSFLLLALFYQIIDVWGIKTWSRPFVWIGMNCMTIYVLGRLCGGYPSLARRVIHAPLETAMGTWGGLAVAGLGLLVAVAIAWSLYRKRVFFRV